GYVQQVGAMLVSGVTNATYGLGRTLSYAASGIGSLFSSSKKSEVNQSTENKLIEEVQNEKAELANMPILQEGYLGNLVETAHNLYLDLMKHADNTEYAINVVGHCLGGYYAQSIASHNNLPGYTFSSFGINLQQADKNRTFVNYRHINDHLTTLNEQHYGKTTALNDLPLTVIDNLDKHINTFKIKDSMETRWAIMDEYLTKNHAIDGFVDQLNPSKKLSKNLQNSNAHIVDRSPAPISSPAAPKADPIVVQPSVASIVPKPIALIAEVKNEAEEIIIAPSIVPASSSEPVVSFTPPPPPPLPAIDGLIDDPVVAADDKPMTKAQELIAKRKLANQKAAKINEAAAANKSALADRIAERLARVEAEGVKEISEEQKIKNAKLFQYREVYSTYDKGALEKALLDIADEQEAYKDSLDDDEVKALHDENRIRRDAIIAVQMQLRAPKK
ncbi:MAG: hypothetical protein Q8K37_08335, partial [Alphaproteobacteria bacterium]|nr:hypothetical protein [Alphaproteobacteria bacterium]